MIHPSDDASSPFLNLPMTFSLPEISMTSTRKGAAATPLTIAERTRSLIGLKWNRLSTVPPTVPTSTSA